METLVEHERVESLPGAIEQRLRSPAFYHFSVDQYEHMIDAGILTENDRVELIHGLILNKMSIGDHHAACVKCLNQLFARRAGESVTISVQDPIQLSDSEPEPDVALLRPRSDFYRSAKPVVGDILLVIEVAETSLVFDRDTKAPLYAAAGIAEYWLVNLIDDCVEVHRQPGLDGQYQNMQTFRSGESLEVSAVPGLKIDVAEIL